MKEFSEELWDKYLETALEQQKKSVVKRKQIDWFFLFLLLGSVNGFMVTLGWGNCQCACLVDNWLWVQSMLNPPYLHPFAKPN